MWVWSITLVELALRFGHVPNRCFMMSLGRGIQSLAWLTFWNYVLVTFWSRIFHLVDTIDHVLSPRFGKTHLRFRTYVLRAAFWFCVLGASEPQMVSLGRGIQSLVWLTFWSYVLATFWSRIFHLVDTIDHVLNPRFEKTHSRSRTYVLRATF